MNKYITSLVLVFMIQIGFSCDFCGCSPNISANDMMAIDMKSSIGISSFYKKSNFFDKTSNIKSSAVSSTVFQGVYTPKDWVDIRINIPLVVLINRYKLSDVLIKENKFSLGDIQILNNYAIWKRYESENRKTTQKLNLGVGLELPTGKKFNTTNDIAQNINFGSQSVDFIFQILYIIAKNNWSFVQAGQIKVNTNNKDNFRFGNNYSYQTMASYTAYVGNSNLIPSLGTRIDYVSKNLHNSIIQNKSGYYLWSLQAGLEWVKNYVHIGFNIEQPLMQNTSMNLISQKNLVNLYFKYNFKSKQK